MRSVTGRRRRWGRVGDPHPAIGHRHTVTLQEVTAVGKRSEEHTSELQSPCNLVCRLLLEKKKKPYRHTAASVPKSTRNATRSSSLAPALTSELVVQRVLTVMQQTPGGSYHTT